jgi:hypothetical protein
MQPPSRKPGPLALAALTLEVELDAFEEAVADVVRVKLDSRKNLERAARGVQKASDLLKRVHAQTTTLATHLTAAHERALDAGNRIGAAATTLGERQQRYIDAVAEHEALRTEAAAVAELAGAGPQSLDAVRSGVRTLGERAGALAEAAREAGFRDLAEEATGHQQRLGALAHRLGGG